MELEAEPDVSSRSKRRNTVRARASVGRGRVQPRRRQQRRQQAARSHTRASIRTQLHRHGAEGPPRARHAAMISGRLA